MNQIYQNQSNYNHVCIYHGGHCLDGFGAAWVFHKFMKNKKMSVEFIPSLHGNAPPDVKDKIVTILDFSYPKDILLKMLNDAHYIVIIDHHKSAFEELGELKLPNLEINFDMNHSGCVLTYQYFFPSHNIPNLLLDIEDRDIWKNKRKNADEITSALRIMYKQDFITWDIIDNYEISSNIQSLFLNEGIVIKNVYNYEIDNVLEYKTQLITLDGYTVPIVNCSLSIASKILNKLAKNYPFAIGYYDLEKFRNFSLRSDTNGIDVSVIAKNHGGGGHYHASGFRIPLKTENLLL